MPTYRVLCNSWPKAGTHLLLELTRLAIGEGKWYHDKDIKYQGDAGLISQVEERLKNYEGQSFAIKGHYGHTTAIEAFLAEHRFAHLFTVRDPREVLCSTQRWLRDLRSDWPVSRHIASLDPESQLEKIILGLPLLWPFDCDCAVRWDQPLPDRYAALTLWLATPDCCVLAYEDLAGARGVSAQFAAIERALRQVQIPFDHGDISQITRLICNPASATFHTGPSSNWENVFTDRHRHLFVEHGGEALVERLGYAPTFSYKPRAERQPVAPVVTAVENSESAILGTHSDKSAWSRAQKAEYEYHTHSQARKTGQFTKNTEKLFRLFQLDPEAYNGRTIVDLGAGSQLRSKYFRGARIAAVEPLASKFLTGISWCDLNDAWKLYSQSAEVFLPELVGEADLVLCINVLDHTYNPTAILANARRYLRSGGTCVLSVDLCERTNEMHPIALNEESLLTIITQTGFEIQRDYKGLVDSIAYGHGVAWTLVLKPASEIRNDVTRPIWLVCSNSSHVKLFGPVARELKAHGWTPTFVSLDNYYGQGSAQALRDMGLERLELPTNHPDQDWYERTHQQRQAWGAEAAKAVQEMFEINAPQVLVVANDTGVLEQFFVQAAERFGTRTVLVQEGALRSPTVNPATGEHTTVMGDGGCELICTWGEGLAGRLRKRGVNGTVEVVGNPLFDLPLPPPTASGGAPETILLIGQCFGKYGELSLEQEHATYEQLIRAILQRKQYRLVFKLHPQQNPEYYAGLHERLGRSFEFLTGGESLASIRTADLVVSVASTMALEAFRLGVPTLTLHYLAPFEVPDLVRLPGGCSSEDEFHRYLDEPESWKGQRSNPESDEAITRELFYKLDGKACERMGVAMENLVSSPIVKRPAVTSVSASTHTRDHHPKNEMTPNQFNTQSGPGWAILQELYATKKALDLAGKVHDLEMGGVPLATGLLLYDLVRQHRPSQTLEVGFAYGYSTLYILQALSDNGGGKHEAIDPIEIDRWHGIGLANVKRAGFEAIFNHCDKPSYLALPRHLSNGFKVDFAFIDGSHLFDDTLLDACYIDRMLSENGILVFDDWNWMPAVRAAASFVERNLPYELVPTPMSAKLRVLRKTAQPPREWDHFVPFEVLSDTDIKRQLSANATVNQNADAKLEVLQARADKASPPPPAGGAHSKMNIALVMAPIWNIQEPPLSVAYISGVLKSAGYNVSCHDFSNIFYSLLPKDVKQEIDQMYLPKGWLKDFNSWKKMYLPDALVMHWVELIMASRPRVVGFSVYYTNLAASLLLASTLKKVSPETVIVFGGAQCLYMETAPGAPYDYMVVGEGEETIVELVRRLEQNEPMDKCAGLVFIRDGQVIDTGTRPLIPDLSVIPYPDFGDFDPKLYPSKNLPMFTSRGCINRCSFCAESSQWVRFRYRLAKDIVSEMEWHMQRYQPAYFDLTDSLINGNFREFEAICDLIIERGLKVAWGGKARIDPRMTKAFMAKAYRAGLRYLMYGIESGSQAVLDHMLKHIKVPVVEEVIRDTKEAGVQVGGFFIVGYVNETEEDFQATLDFLRRNRDNIDIVFPGNGLAIQKGSLLHEKARDYGIVLPEDGQWRTDDGSNTSSIRADRVARFRALVSELYQR
jgi:predicted O-methyltransferase YrrM